MSTINDGGPAFPPSGFDHGALNVPLAKRQGNIDAQIDRYKAQQAKDAAEKHSAILRSEREKKARVVALLCAMSDELVLALAAPLGKRKPSAARAALLSEFSLNFDLWLKRLDREVQA